MKIIVLNSDVDVFIITNIVVITVVIILAKLKYQKKESVHSFDHDEADIDLSHYMLNFDVIPVDPKTVSFTSKLVLFTLALAIIFIPLYEFIITLTPEVVYYGFILF